MAYNLLLFIFACPCYKTILFVALWFVVALICATAIVAVFVPVVRSSVPLVFVWLISNFSVTVFLPQVVVAATIHAVVAPFFLFLYLVVVVASSYHILINPFCSKSMFFLSHSLFPISSPFLSIQVESLPSLLASTCKTGTNTIAQK